MSDSNAIVSIIFEEMAEEENLFSADRSPFFAGLYPTIDEAQVKILEGIILSRAGRIGCNPLVLREAMIDTYQLDELKDLSRSLFEDAVRYLVDFAGVN